MGEIYGDFELKTRIVGTNKFNCECIHCGNVVQKFKHQLEKGYGIKCESCNPNSVKHYKSGDIIGDYRLLSKIDGVHHGWLCECINCGDKQEKLIHNLKTGAGYICRKCKPVDKSKEYFDLTGRMFGYLEPIEYNNDGSKSWKCLCHLCNNIKNIRTVNLLNGSTISCGCLEEYKREHDTMIGKTVGDWDVVSKIKGRQLYECVCKVCGNRDYLNAVDVRKGTVRGCNYCNGNPVNKYENELLNIFGNGKVHDRVMLNGMEIDVYYPEERVGIEFNGNYWHSELFKDSKRHFNKTVSAVKNGIRLIHIFEYEWDDKDKRDKIISLVNNSLNKINKKIIYARKTVVKEISREDAKVFLEKYHLNGYSNSGVHIGTYYSDELIGVMTFGAPRFNNEEQWELIRLAYRNDINIVGGSNKMFKHFINRYNPKSIVSYCDLAKFTGNVYLGLGFRFVKFTKPNYVWFGLSNHKVISRYRTNRENLIKKLELDSDCNLTESDIMHCFYYVKIYDCGNAKYVWSHE